MHVPDPVVSLALIPKDRNQTGFGKALGRFTKPSPSPIPTPHPNPNPDPNPNPHPDPNPHPNQEDPTFRVHTDDESNQTIISGMGETSRSNPNP
eukprot:scaffold699_cov44-Phaeocystis_antarctica.AAC.1